MIGFLRQNAGAFPACTDKRVRKAHRRRSRVRRGRLSGSPSAHRRTRPVAGQDLMSAEELVAEATTPDPHLPDKSGGCSTANNGRFSSVFSLSCHAFAAGPRNAEDSRPDQPNGEHEEADHRSKAEKLPGSKGMTVASPSTRPRSRMIPPIKPSRPARRRSGGAGAARSPLR